MGRKLGEILVDDFGWKQDLIDGALSEQVRAPTTRRRLGDLLRRGVNNHESATQIALAVSLQRAEANTAGSAEMQFDLLEYAEIGNQLRDGHDDIASKIRAYAVVLVGLLLFVAYPINAVLTLSEDQFARLKDLTTMYSGVGILVTLCALFLGDSVVKSYGYFLKRRWRLALARRELRLAAIQRGQATRTAMPYREASREIWNGVDVVERPEPEFGGVQHFIPLLFTLGSFTKLALVAFFVACWSTGSLRVDRDSMRRAAILVLACAPGWYFVVGTMCERYHKSLFEAVRITSSSPYPRASTRQFSVGRRWWYGRAWKVGYGLGWVALAAVAVVTAKTKGAEASLNLFNISVSLSIVYVVARVLHVLSRVKRMQLVERKTPIR